MSGRDVADAGAVALKLKLVDAPSQFGRSSSADVVGVLVDVVAVAVADAVAVKVAAVVAVEVAAVVAEDMGIARKVSGVVGNTCHCVGVAVGNTSWSHLGDGFGRKSQTPASLTVGCDIRDTVVGAAACERRPSRQNPLQ